MSNSEILKKHLGDNLIVENDPCYDVPKYGSSLSIYYILVNSKWENFINGMAAEKVLEHINFHIKPMFVEMLECGLDSDVVDMKSRLNKAYEEMK